jgi:hypothetical protein
MVTFSPMISLIRSILDKAPKVPDPGQRVLLFENDEWCVGYRAVSEPITAETGEVVILVAREEEFRAARWDGRFPVGKPWPVSRMTVPRRDEQRARRRAKRKARRQANGSPGSDQGRGSNRELRTARDRGANNKRKAERERKV